MAKSMLHAVVGMLVDEGRLVLDAPAPVPAVAVARRSPARRSPSSTCSTCATVSTSWRSTRIAETSDVLQMLFGRGKTDMAAFAADRPLAAAAGDPVQLLQRHQQHDLGHRGPHRRARSSPTGTSWPTGCSDRWG